MRLFKKITVLLLLVFVAMQFYRPKKNTSQEDHSTFFLTETNPPNDVKHILKQTCYNCHSNNTIYPWYNNIAPISYWLASHVKEGKRRLNFSDWNGYTVKEKGHKLEEVIELVSKEKMPFPEYTWTHGEAILTTQQRSAVVEWAKRTNALYQLNFRPE